jgi:hypothetical protein
MILVITSLIAFFGFLFWQADKLNAKREGRNVEKKAYTLNSYLNNV